MHHLNNLHKKNYSKYVAVDICWLHSRLLFYTDLLYLFELLIIFKKKKKAPPPSPGVC